MRLDTGLDDDAPMRRALGELERVGQQVDDDLADALRVTAQPQIGCDRRRKQQLVLDVLKQLRVNQGMSCQPTPCSYLGVQLGREKAQVELDQAIQAEVAYRQHKLARLHPRCVQGVVGDHALVAAQSPIVRAAVIAARACLVCAWFLTWC